VEVWIPDGHQFLSESGETEKQGAGIIPQYEESVD